MKTILTATLLTGSLLAALDFIWLGVVAPSFYREQLGSLLRPQFLYTPAVIFYCIYALALAVVIVVPSLQDHSLAKVALHGALVGLSAYAAYNFTNLATIKGWPWTMTLVDLTWGTSMTTVAVVLASVGLRWFMR